MANRFDAYRFRANKTPLSADVFNARWSDIDSRIGQLETISSQLESSINQLTELGIERLEESVLPVVEDAAQLIADAQAELEALNSPASESQLDAQTGFGSDATFSYDGDSRVSGVTETIDGKTRTTAMTYNVGGNLTQVVIEFDGTRRTESYNYDGDGRIAEMTATEEAI